MEHNYFIAAALSVQQTGRVGVLAGGGEADKNKCRTNNSNNGAQQTLHKLSRQNLGRKSSAHGITKTDVLAIFLPHAR
eukprot:303980-Chlamydomonas_euryale.AAC.10